MKEVKLNKKFAISVEKIEDDIRQKINDELEGYDTIVSPREIVRVDNLSSMKNSILESLLRNVPLRGDPDQHPYKYSGIKVFQRSPNGHTIGQTFIVAPKLLGIMDSLEGNIFGDYAKSGISQIPQTLIYGRNAEDEKVVAFYVPPILEIHGNQVVLIDGTHRNYICRKAGATPFAIHITEVSSPLPFDPINWDDATVVSHKPPIGERYVNLNKYLFRDLATIGVDG